MTLLSVVQDVCAVVGVLRPQSVFSNITGNRTMQEMLVLANEMAQRIAYDNRDWTRLLSFVTIDGDGVADRFNLPFDYKRMLLTTNVRRTSTPTSVMQFVPDLDQWIDRQANNRVDAYGEWTIYGGQILTRPVLALGDKINFAYLQKNCISLASGGLGDSFMGDNDSFLLDERVLKLGMIWQWKAQKGASYAEDLGTYGDALGYAMGHDSPAPIIIGRKVSSWGKVVGLT